MDELIEKVLSEAERLSQAGVISDYEEFERFVELRQLLTDEVHAQAANLTLQQKQEIRRLLAYDPLILTEMQRLKDEAGTAMTRVQASKKQFTAYNNSGVYDSFMMDKRK